MNIKSTSKLSALALSLLLAACQDSSKIAREANNSANDAEKLASEIAAQVAASTPATAASQ